MVLNSGQGGKGTKSVDDDLEVMEEKLCLWEVPGRVNPRRNTELTFSVSCQVIVMPG